MYTLRHIPDWASLIVRLALADAGAPCTILPLDYDAGDLDSPGYRALNPLGLIPVLETPDGPVFETGAILLWLSERHPGMAPAPHTIARAPFLSWLFFTANTLHPTVMDIAHPERPGGDAATAAVLARVLARYRDQIAHLERVATTAPAWLDPAAPSVLVPYIAVMLRWAVILAPDPATAITPAAAPHLKAILAAYEARPQIAAIAVEEGLGPTPFSAPHV